METVVVASGSAETASVIARRLAAERVNLALIADARHSLGDLASSVVAAGAAAVLAIPCDPTDPSQLVAAVQRVEDELGPIDRWVNAALSEYGFVCCTRAALDRMRTRDRGTIIQVAAPRAVRMFSQGLRGELRLAGSHVALECVRTQPFRRLGAATIAGATIVGAALLRRIVRST
jgi:short-subunit dehydrogenase